MCLSQWYNATYKHCASAAVHVVVRRKQRSYGYHGLTVTFPLVPAVRISVSVMVPGPLAALGLVVIKPARVLLSNPNTPLGSSLLRIVMVDTVLVPRRAPFIGFWSLQETRMFKNVFNIMRIVIILEKHSQKQKSRCVVVKCDSIPAVRQNSILTWLGSVPAAQPPCHQ